MVTSDSIDIIHVSSVKKGRAKQKVVPENDPGHTNGPNPIQAIQSVGSLLVVLLENELQIAVQRKCSNEFEHHTIILLPCIIFCNDVFIPSHHINKCSHQDEESNDAEKGDNNIIFGLPSIAMFFIISASSGAKMIQCNFYLVRIMIVICYP